MRGIFGRQWRLLAFIAVIVVVFWILYALRTILLPFVVGIILAYLLLPLIQWLEWKLPRRGKWNQTKRISLILLIFLIILAAVGFFSYYIATAVVQAFVALFNNAPTLISAGVQAFQNWTEQLREGVPTEIQQQIDSFLTDVGIDIGNAIKALFNRGTSLIPATFGMVIGFAALPIFLFFILKDWEKLKISFYSLLPPWVAEHVKQIISIIDRVMGRYIRAQLLLGFMVAYLSFIGLLILQIPLAPALSAFAGLTELVPMIGPWIGGLVAVIVTLATVPDKVIWVVVLFLVVQLLENNLLVPRIHGSYLHINPAILLVLLVVGAYIAGFWGVLLAAPLTATVVEIYKYIRQHWGIEEIEDTLKK